MGKSFSAKDPLYPLLPASQNSMAGNCCERLRWVSLHSSAIVKRLKRVKSNRYMLEKGDAL